MKESTRHLIELYRRGSYKLLDLFPKQQDALTKLQERDIIEVLYGGGARGGKSWFGCTWQLFNRLSMPKSFGLIAREEYTKLRDTTLLTFFKVCSYYGLKAGEDFIYNQQTSRCEFPNGSIIFFKEIKYTPSDPEFDRLGSYDLTDLFLDESQQIHFKARSVLRGRLSVLKGDGWHVTPKMFYSCNPAKNWIYTDFVRPHTEKTIGNKKAFIPSLAIDNPYVEQSYIDNLKNSDKITRERLLYGNFDYDDDPAALCDYNAICDVFTNDFVDYGIKRVSSDLAMQGRDLFVCALWDGLRVQFPIVKSKTTGKQIENDLRSLINYHEIGRSNVVADSDGMGNYLESYLIGIREFHGNSSAVNKEEFANIKSECAFKLAELINQRKIFIQCNDEQKQTIIEELSMLKRDKVDDDTSKKRLIKKDKMKEMINRSPDFLDTLLMGMIFHLMPLEPYKHIKTGGLITANIMDEVF